jgi:hypothetical protein
LTYNGLPGLFCNTGRPKLIVGATHGNGGSKAAVAKEAWKDLKIDITNPLFAHVIYLLISMLLEQGRFRVARNQQCLTKHDALSIAVFIQHKRSMNTGRYGNYAALFLSPCLIITTMLTLLMDFKVASTISESGIVRFCWRTYRLNSVPCYKV